MSIGFTGIDLIALIVLAAVVVVMMIIHGRLDREKQELRDALSEKYAEKTISMDYGNE